MTRLWDKGIALDARVLAYTAGEDYLLDNRLVPYDIKASSAHADMLAQRGLLSRSTRKANGASRSSRRIARRRSRIA
jgi:argininosuccinate lyase